MKANEINIRDPFIVYENGIYYMYGTRAKDFGCHVGGVDVYRSKDLESWSEPIECFNSEQFGLNRMVNWAPEVHRYKGAYYMFITLTQENGLRGTYSLRADSPLGPFKPHSAGALTPNEWECLDGTLYVDDAGAPYLVFCHEHTQIIDGTICYARMNETLDALEGDVVTLFAASESAVTDPSKNGHFVTDGPFLYRTKTNELLMIWSSFIKGKYAELAVKFKNGTLGTEFTHLPPLLDSDGGHGMIFCDEKHTYFTYHTPNKSLCERPAFCPVADDGDTIRLEK